MRAPHPCWPSAQPQFESVTQALWTADTIPGVDGELFKVKEKTGVNQQACLLLAELVRKVQPTHTLEVGCAYGFSSVYIVGALAQVGGVQHVSVDPFQDTAWRGIGRTTVQRAGLAELHTVVTRMSDAVLPSLYEHNARFGLIFVDGDHKFDAIIADVRNAGRILLTGGLLVLDDVWMASTRTAMSWIEANLPYERLVARFNLAVYKKTGDDTRHWTHFEPFLIARKTG